LFPTRRSWPLSTLWPSRCATSARRSCDESACLKCFRCFRCMLLRMDVAKVDQGYCICCKCFIGLFKTFHLFQMYVASVLIWRLHMFHTYVLQQYFPNVSVVSVLCCIKCFHVASCKCFIRMLHMFHTYVSSVCSRYFINFIRMLHSSVLCCTCFM
jgi:hypothetical protein